MGGDQFPQVKIKYHPGNPRAGGVSIDGNPIRYVLRGSLDACPEGATTVNLTMICDAELMNLATGESAYYPVPQDETAKIYFGTWSTANADLRRVIECRIQRAIDEIMKEAVDYVR